MSQNVPQDRGDTSVELFHRNAHVGFDPSVHALPTDNTRTRRPSPARFVAVLTGTSEWTQDEREAIEADTYLQNYERRMSEMLFGELPPDELVVPRSVVLPERCDDWEDPAPEEEPDRIGPVLNFAPRPPQERLRIDAMPGHEVLVYQAGGGQWTVQWVGPLPAAPAAVRLTTVAPDPQPIPLVQGFDEHGYARVAAAGHRLLAAATGVGIRWQTV